MLRPQRDLAVMLMALCAVPAALAAIDQQPPATFNPTTGKGQISGTVIAADTGLPVRRATVLVGETRTLSLTVK